MLEYYINSFNKYNKAKFYAALKKENEEYN
jgi:hypothetical protein